MSIAGNDGGNLLFLNAFSYFDVTGITFGLLWRFRELVWVGSDSVSSPGPHWWAFCGGPGGSSL
jgi:hypothetical protein